MDGYGWPVWESRPTQCLRVAEGERVGPGPALEGFYLSLGKAWQMT